MLRHVAFISRREAESLDGTPSQALISITDPLHYPAQLRPGWHDVLRLEFDDINRETWPRVLFTEADARAIVRFVEAANTGDCVGMLVHCKAGVSRSAAVARWIAERYGLPFNMSYAGYNPHVYRLLHETAAVDEAGRGTGLNSKDESWDC